MTLLTDGKGSGNKMGINTDNRALVDSISHPVLHFMSLMKSAGAFLTTDYRLLTASSAEHALFYIKNISVDKHFNFETLETTSNGGISGIDPACFRLYINPSPPTANNESVIPVNPQAGSSFIPPLDFQRWNLTGLGMTVADKGKLAWVMSSTATTDFFNSQGNPIISPDKSALVTVVLPQALAQILSVSVSGYHI